MISKVLNEWILLGSSDSLWTLKLLRRCHSVRFLSRLIAFVFLFGVSQSFFRTLFLNLMIGIPVKGTD
jgi:hypothetical protein